MVRLHLSRGERDRVASGGAEAHSRLRADPETERAVYAGLRLSRDLSLIFS